MSFKKHNWTKYGKGTSAKKATLHIEDEDGNVLEKVNWDLQNKDMERRIFTKFKHKYGVFKKPENDLEYLKNNFLKKDLVF